MKRLLIAAALLFANPAFAEDAQPKEPTIADLQKQVVDLKGAAAFWHSAADSYRERFEAEVAATVQLKAQAGAEAQKKASPGK